MKNPSPGLFHMPAAISGKDSQTCVKTNQKLKETSCQHRCLSLEFFIKFNHGLTIVTIVLLQFSHLAVILKNSGKQMTNDNESRKT